MVSVLLIKKKMEMAKERMIQLKKQKTWDSFHKSYHETTKDNRMVGRSRFTAVKDGWALGKVDREKSVLLRCGL